MESLTLGEIQVPLGFSVEEGLQGPLGQGESDEFTVRLDTDSVGAKTGRIVFSNNDGDENPFDFAITGNVEEPEGADIEIEVDGTLIVDGQSAPIDFGSVIQGALPPAKTFTVRNIGTTTLTLGTPQPPPGYEVTEGLVASLQSDEFDTFEVRMNSVNPGKATGFVQISNNDDDENPFDFTVTGEVIALASEVTVMVDDLEIEDGQPAPISLGSVRLGAPGALKAFTVRNDGNSRLTLGSVSIDPAAGSHVLYEVVDELKSSLAPGESDTFSLRTVDTTFLGDRTATIRFSNNDTDESPFNFRVTSSITAPTYYLSTSSGGTATSSDGSRVSFDHSDIIKLTVEGNGEYRFEMYFDGGDVGLTTSGEDIDAFAILDSGEIIVSTRGLASLGNLFAGP